MRDKSKFAGKTVIVVSGEYKGQEILIEDWWQNVSGKSWMSSDGNPACLQYAIRTVLHNKVPLDNEVLYGMIGELGHLVHITELEYKERKEGE